MSLYADAFYALPPSLGVPSLSNGSQSSAGTPGSSALTTPVDELCDPIWAKGQAAMGKTGGTRTTPGLAELANDIAWKTPRTPERTPSLRDKVKVPSLKLMFPPKLKRGNVELKDFGHKVTSKLPPSPSSPTLRQRLQRMMTNSGDVESTPASPTAIAASPQLPASPTLRQRFQRRMSSDSGIDTDCPPSPTAPRTRYCYVDQDGSIRVKVEMGNGEPQERRRYSVPWMIGSGVDSSKSLTSAPKLREKRRHSLPYAKDHASPWSEITEETSKDKEILPDFEPVAAPPTLQRRRTVTFADTVDPAVPRDAMEDCFATLRTMDSEFAFDLRDLPGYLMEAPYFILWSLVVGVAMLCFPKNLDTFVFKARQGCLDNPRNPLHRFAILSDFVNDLVLISAATIAGTCMYLGAAWGSLVLIGVTTMLLYAWHDFRQDPGSPLGMDDRQSLYRILFGGCVQRDEGATVSVRGDRACKELIRVIEEHRRTARK